MYWIWAHFLVLYCLPLVFWACLPYCARFNPGQAASGRWLTCTRLSTRFFFATRTFESTLKRRSLSMVLSLPSPVNIFVRGISTTSEGIFPVELYATPFWVVLKNLLIYSLIWNYNELDYENLHVAQVHYLFWYGPYWLAFCLYNSVEAFRCASQQSDIGSTMEEVLTKCQNPLEPTHNFIWAIFVGHCYKSFSPLFAFFPFNSKGASLNVKVNDVVRFDVLLFKDKCNIDLLYAVIVSSLMNYALINDERSKMTEFQLQCFIIYFMNVMLFLIFLGVQVPYNVFKEKLRRKQFAIPE